MVARDPNRNIVLDPHPQIEKDKDGNVSSKGNPQINSTKNLDVDRAEPSDPVSGTSSGETKAKPGQQVNTVTGDVSDQPATAPADDDSSSSKKKG